MSAVQYFSWLSTLSTLGQGNYQVKKSPGEGPGNFLIAQKLLQSVPEAMTSMSHRRPPSFKEGRCLDGKLKIFCSANPFLFLSSSHSFSQQAKESWTLQNRACYYQNSIQKKKGITVFYHYCVGKVAPERLPAVYNSWPLPSRLTPHSFELMEDLVPPCTEHQGLWPAPPPPPRSGSVANENLNT